MNRPIPLAAGALPAAAFRAPARIRFQECDPAGIVFFANWFGLASAAIEEWFGAELGVDFHELHGARRTGTGFAHAEADYFIPGLMGQHILITPLVEAIGGASYTLRVHIHNQEGAEMVRLRLISATTNLDTRRVMPIPADLRAALAAYQARCAPPETPA
ncbi:acyl-CoA thioesterase [Roseomonas sp. GC11]|uniref:acyl-CoA thioesterase n=1 Tax=Roseomonas sp. GC11 TaxID=2950546 RepID=UPI00210AB310|nr:thioesterase family protein [Roseomonas sp. GC11]MCQ4158424.1 acyl-CoA thioesterase [Roseomonas sp. GC11]